MADQIKAIIFDMGGVILRTEDYTTRTRLAERFGLTREQLEALIFDSESANEATVGRKSAEAHWKTVWEGLGVPAAEWKACEKEFWGGDRLDDRLIGFLREQKEFRKTALLSNAWSEARDLLTNIHPCMDAFDVSIFSYEVGLVKPDPAIYQLTLERVGVEAAQAVFLDDNEANILSAARMGIHAIRFINPTQALDQIGALI